MDTHIRNIFSQPRACTSIRRLSALFAFSANLRRLRFETHRGSLTTHYSGHCGRIRKPRTYPTLHGFCRRKPANAQRDPDSPTSAYRRRTCSVNQFTCKRPVLRAYKQFHRMIPGGDRVRRETPHKGDGCGTRSRNERSRPGNDRESTTGSRTG